MGKTGSQSVSFPWERDVLRRVSRKRTAQHGFEYPSTRPEGAVDSRSSSVLPPELWVDIFEYMGIAELRVVRLVDRSFSGLAAPLLFQRGRLYCTEESFLRLERLASHPVLASYVRSICFDTRSLPDDLSIFAWKMEAKAWDSIAWGFLSVKERKQHYRKFSRRVLFQNTLNERAKLLFQLALHSFSSIQELVVTCGREEQRRAERGQLDPAPSIRAVRDATLVPPSFEAGLLHHQRHVTTVVMTVAEVHPASLRSLKLDYVDMAFLDLEPSTFMVVYNAFISLHQLYLEFIAPDATAVAVTDVPNFFADWMMRVARLGILIWAPEKLTTLHISFVRDRALEWSEDAPDVRLRDLLRRQKLYPNLKNLTFGQILIDSTSTFIDYLLLHQSCLRHLNLEDLTLEKGTWVDFFRALRELKLAQINLRGIFLGVTPRDTWYAYDETPFSPHTDRNDIGWKPMSNMGHGLRARLQGWITGDEGLYPLGPTEILHSFEDRSIGESLDSVILGDPSFCRKHDAEQDVPVRMEDDRLGFAAS